MASQSSENEPNSTPKLSLSKLPSKLREQPVMATPPLNRLASIPFQWEEVPGKPRADFISTASNTTTMTTKTTALHNKNSVARCLELPPRLLNSSAKVIDEYSPTTVLEGPDDCSILTRTRSFSSLPKGSFRSLIEEEVDRGEWCEKSENMIGKESQRLKFSSWRWGSFKEIRGMAGNDSPNFSTCTKVSSKIRHRSSAKLSKVKRRSSFFNFSHAGSNLLSGVYGSLKQVVSWRR